MSLSCSVLIALTLSTGAVDGRTTTAPSAPAVEAAVAPSIARAVATTPLRELSEAKPLEAWMVDRQERRPAALVGMYATLGALNVLDVYSSRRAIGAGANEANPLMRKAAGSSGTMLAVKALSTAGTIFFTERAWKKNRKAAILMMAVINGATAAISARNFRNAQR
jgi:hypothetical protein